MNAPGRSSRPLLGAALAAALIVLATPGAASAQTDEPPEAAAADRLLITTPYPAVETRPGSVVQLDLRAVSPTPTPVDLVVEGMPEGWQATLRGGGFVIRSITAEPDPGASVDLELVVPPDADPGEYPIEVVAAGRDEEATVGLTVVVAEQVNSGIRLTADFPTLSGEPGGTFDYNLTVANDTPTEQTFTFDPAGPQGWTVSASPSAEARAQTVTIEAGSTASVEVTATAPQSVEQGTYPIEVTVIAPNGATGTIMLEAEVVGTPALSLATADERLNVSGEADAEKRIPLIVANTGTAPLEVVRLAGTAPSGWDVSFDPQDIDAVQPGETAQVTAVVQPAAEAVAGDYSLTVRASAGSLSSDIDLRYTVEGSRTLGIIAIGVIVAAFVALGAVFVKFGRR
jgi:uncharacterized membrane protein